MGTKQRMRNEVPQIGLGFKFNFVLNYIFLFLVSPLPRFSNTLGSVAAMKYFIQCSARTELLLCAE